MKFIEDKILQDGHIIGNDILKVDSFLNHQIDYSFLQRFAAEVKRQFDGVPVNRIVTIEASGIAVACAMAEAYGGIPIVFGKKQKSKTVDPSNVYSASVNSFTHGNTATVTISKRYLNADDSVLIVDDFLAEGSASLGLYDLCKQAGANVVGVAIVIEKVFQGGRAKLEQLGLKVVAGASITAFSDNKPVF